MRKTLFLLPFISALLFCGCDQQAKVNSKKIDLLSQHIIQLEQSQAKQMANLQAQFNALVPSVNQIDNSYFEKNRDNALFFHTNTLYLLLTVAKQIEAQLQVAENERQTQNSQAYNYHTNQLTTLYLCTAQIEDVLNAQEGRMETNVNAETERAVTDLRENLQKQIKLSAPDPAEAVRLKELDAEVKQIRLDLDAIKMQLANANQPATHP